MTAPLDQPASSHLRPRHRAVVVANPVARRAVPLHAIRVAAALALPGWDVEVVETARGGDAARLASIATRAEVDAVVACGGDGTLNGVINGVASALDGRHSGPAIGLIPAGTANVWAKEARIPRDPEHALSLLESGVRVPLDLGIATLRGESRRFLLMCGVGLDAAVVGRVESRPRLKRRLGPLAFVGQGVATLARWQPVYASVEVDGEVRTQPLALAIAGNTRLYGGVARVVAAARADDGLLDLVTFEAAEGRRGALLHGRQALAALAGRLDRMGVRGAAYRRGAAIGVRPERALAVQVDGEWLGECGPEAPLTLGVEPRALTFALPAVPSPLFSLPAVP
ncbi:MAG: hypothetical protein AMXMBFR23_05950 [Chloroflexota bacterium]